jgi:hypothetical protein
MKKLSSDQALGLLRLVTGAAATSLTTSEFDWEHLQAVLQHEGARRIVDREVAQTLRRLSDMHILDVDYRQSIDDVRPINGGGMLDFGCASNDRISSNYFPDTPDRGVEQVCSELLSLESGIKNLTDLQSHIKAQGMRPANLRELIAFQRLDTDRQRKGLIVALGSSCTDDSYPAYGLPPGLSTIPVMSIVKVPTTFNGNEAVKFLCVLVPDSTGT